MEKEKTSQGEKVTNTATASLPVKIIERLPKVREIAGKSVCKIMTLHKDQGAGALFQVKDENGKTHYLIMTCNHVLPTNSLSEIIQSKLKFEDIEQMASINLDREHVQYIWTSKLLDATVIEISPELHALYSSYGARFLKVGQVTAKVEIAIFHFSPESVSISHGGIEEVNGSNVFYQIGTAPRNSGYPLLTGDCEALAMHNASGAHSVTIRKANSLSAVVKAYLQERSENDKQITAMMNQLLFLRNELQMLRDLKENFEGDKEKLQRLRSQMDQSKLEAQSLINLGKSLAIDNCTKIESTRELVNPEEQKQIVVNCDNGELNELPLDSAANMSHLRLASRIPQRSLTRGNNEILFICGLCALPNDVVLLACSTKGVRALSLSTEQLYPRDYALRDSFGIAFDAATDTLLIAKWVAGVNGGMYWLLSARSGQHEWSEVQRVQTSITRSSSPSWAGLSVLSNSRVFFGCGDYRDRLCAFEVTGDHCLRPLGDILLKKDFREFACTLEVNDTLVALSHYDKTVSLHRLVGLQLDSLGFIELTDPSKVLFRNHLLLVADWNEDVEKHAIVSLDVANGQLTNQKQLLDANVGVEVEAWSLAEDRLVVWDWKSEDLMIYAFI